jgi:hypothetical protein
LGAEEFLHIKCGQSGLKPDAVVLVATIRAIKHHAGLSAEEFKTENVPAIAKGFCNLEKHIENIQKFGLNPVVCINAFPDDTEAEYDALKALCLTKGVTAIVSKAFVVGGKGSAALAEKVIEEIESGKANYKPLYQIFPYLSISDKNDIISKIHLELSCLHQDTSFNVSKKIFYESLIIETYSKLKERILEINLIIEQYSYIKRVNGISIISFDTALEIINYKIKKYIDSLSSYSLSLIHGDCQFNNILYNTITNHICFIDPRGYFGNQLLFGIKEYDYAKIRFALSGYDIFDNMDIQTLDIQDDNININIQSLLIMDNIFNNDIITVLTLSIWLGNSHCFKNNISKALVSYFYSLYLCTLYL